MNNAEIEASARGRLHRQLLTELDERGIDGIDLDAALAQARASRADFEARYESVEACLLEAFDEVTAGLDAELRAACRSAAAAGDWTTRVRAGLRALLERLAAEPGITRAAVCSFPTIGPRAQARAQAFVESFGPMLTPGRDLAADGTELPREVEMLATGAAEAILFEEVASGRAAELPAMLPSLLFSLLVPFIGPARAGKEMELARAGM